MQKSTLLVDDNGAISQDLENYLLKKNLHPFCSKNTFQSALSSSYRSTTKKRTPKAQPFIEKRKDHWKAEKQPCPALSKKKQKDQEPNIPKNVTQNQIPGQLYILL